MPTTWDPVPEGWEDYDPPFTGLPENYGHCFCDERGCSCFGPGSEVQQLAPPKEGLTCSAPSSLLSDAVSISLLLAALSVMALALKAYRRF